MSMITQDPAECMLSPAASSTPIWSDGGCVPPWLPWWLRMRQGSPGPLALASPGDNHGKAVRDLLTSETASLGDPIRYINSLLERLESDALITAPERGLLIELFSWTTRKGDFAKLVNRFSVIRNGLQDDPRTSVLASAIADIALDSAFTVLVNPPMALAEDSGSTVVGEDLRGAIAGAAVGAGFGLVGALIGAIAGAGLTSAAAFADKKAEK